VKAVAVQTPAFLKFALPSSECRLAVEQYGLISSK
jgi:hypothetical protein